MKISTQENPAVNHIVFAWLPVNVFNRTTGNMDLLWLEKVQRKLISISGHTMWSYSQCRKTKNVEAALIPLTASANIDTTPDILWLPSIENDEYPVVPLGVNLAIAYDKDIEGETKDERYVRVYRNGEWGNPEWFTGNVNDYLKAGDSCLRR